MSDEDYWSLSDKLDSLKKVVSKPLDAMENKMVTKGCWLWL